MWETNPKLCIPSSETAKQGKPKKWHTCQLPHFQGCPRSNQVEKIKLKEMENRAPIRRFLNATLKITTIITYEITSFRGSTKWYTNSLKLNMTALESFLFLWTFQNFMKQLLVTKSHNDYLADTFDFLMFLATRGSRILLWIKLNKQRYITLFTARRHAVTDDRQFADIFLKQKKHSINKP